METRFSIKLGITQEILILCEQNAKADLKIYRKIIYTNIY